MKNIYVFIIAIAYCFAVRANQFTKKFVRRSACSLGESRELRMLYVLSVILSTISFWRFVFLFALQSCSVTFSQRILYFVTSCDDVFLWSHATSSVEWGKMWACFNVWRVYLSRGSIVSVTEECFWFAYCKCVDVQFDWLCDFRRYVDVLQRFVRSLLVIYG